MSLPRNPEGFIILYPSGLVGHGHGGETDLIIPAVPGLVYMTDKLGEEGDTDLLLGGQGYINLQLTTGATGAERLVLALTNADRTCFLVVIISSTNRITLIQTDNDGNVVASSTVPAGTLPAGTTVEFGYAWDSQVFVEEADPPPPLFATAICEGALPLWGTAPENPWTAFVPTHINVGNPEPLLGYTNPFNGTITFVQIGNKARTPPQGVTNTVQPPIPPPGPGPGRKRRRRRL